MLLLAEYLLLALFIFPSTSAQETKSSRGPGKTSISSEMVNVISPNQTARNIYAFTAIDVRTLLLIIDSTGKRHVQFLYSPGYEDIVSGLGRPLSKEYKGLTTLNNDGLMTTVKSLLDTAINNTLLVLLDSPTSVIQMFQMMKKKILSSHFVSWLLVIEGNAIEKTILSLEYLVPEGTEVRIFAKEFSGSFKAFLSRVDRIGVTRFVEKGQWANLTSVNKGVFKEPTNRKKPIHYSVSGRHMTIGVKANYVSLNLGKIYPDRTVELDSGGDVSIIRALSSALNFTYTALLPPDNQWGEIKADGNITGIIGIVARREASFGISAMAMTAERETILDFTFQYFYPRLLLLSRSPKKKNRAFAVLTSFRPQVWLCTSAVVIFMGLSLHVFSRLVDVQGSRNVLGNYLWNTFNVFRNIVAQGNLIRADTWPMRFTLFSWYLFCLIFSALYSGMLTAVIAVPSYETPIDSLEDLPRAVKDGFTLGVIGDTTNEYFFKSATEGIFKQTYDLFNHKDRSKSFVDGPLAGLDRVLKEKFVFIIADAYANGYARRYGPKNFHFSRERFLPTYPAMTCQVGSPFRETFSYMLIKMQQGGLVSKWVEDEYRKIREERSTEKEVKTSSITLVQLQAAYYLLFLGMSASAVVMLVENLVFLYHQSKPGLR